MDKIINIKGVVNGLNSEVHFAPYLMSLDWDAKDFLNVQIPYDIRFLPVIQKICFFSAALPEKEENYSKMVSKLIKHRYPIFQKDMNNLIEMTHCEFSPHIAESDEFARLDKDSIDFVKIQQPFSFNEVSEDTRTAYLWLLRNFKKSFNSQQFFWMDESNLACENFEDVNIRAVKQLFINHTRKEPWFQDFVESDGDSIKLDKCLRYAWHGYYLNNIL